MKRKRPGEATALLMPGRPRRVPPPPPPGFGDEVISDNDEMSPDQILTLGHLISGILQIVWRAWGPAVQEIQVEISVYNSSI